MGAWIETRAHATQKPTLCVAPRVGAWIETFEISAASISLSSRPAWARGLKHLGLTQTLNFTSRAPRGRVD